MNVLSGLDPMLALSAKILSLRQVLRTLWSLPIFRELCLLLDVDGSPSWRTQSICLGLRRPDLAITFRDYHPGSAPISGLVNSGYDTRLQHSVQLFFSFLIQGEGHLRWNGHLERSGIFFECDTVTVLRTTWGTCLLLCSCSHHCTGCQVCLSASEIQLAFFLAKVAPNLLLRTLAP